jgi:hypothetical protein
MDDPYQQIINDFLSDLKKAEEAVVHIKATINSLCEKGSKPRMFSDSELLSSSKPQPLRSDQFHGRPLATVVREYLEIRRQLNQGPADVSEIFEALLQGGYKFNTKSDQISKISLNGSLGKNPIFYKLPNKKWGLTEWYPNAKRKVAPRSEEDEAGTNSNQSVDAPLSETRQRKRLSPGHKVFEKPSKEGG